MAHTICTADRAEELLYLRDRWRTLADTHTDLGSKLTDLFAGETTEFGLECALLSDIDLDNGIQHFQIVHGPTGRIQSGASVPLQKTYCRKTISAAEGSFAISDAVAEGWEDDPAYEEFQMSSYVGSPVTVDGTLYGTLCFMDADPREEPITRLERHLVETYSDWTAYELSHWAEEPPRRDVTDATGGHVLSSSQIDSMMGILTNPVNRTIIMRLLDGTTTVEEIKQYIDDENIELKLHHNHLPKLAQAGYIDRNTELDTLTRGTNFYQVEPVARFLEKYTTEVE